MKFFDIQRIKNEDGSESSDGVVYIESVINDEAFWGDEVTPDAIRAEIAKYGNLTIYISSPGGDVIAASKIYSMLREHSDSGKGRIRTVVTGIAASAASVILQAGDIRQISPTAYIMIHNVSTVAMGNKKDMSDVVKTLKEFDRGIAQVYQEHTGLSLEEIEKMMDAETYMNAYTALEKHFVDEIIGGSEGRGGQPVQLENRAYRERLVALVGSHYGAKRPDQAVHLDQAADRAADQEERPDQTAAQEEQLRKDIAMRALLIADLYKTHKGDK